jgi:hypothetical protein
MPSSVARIVYSASYGGGRLACTSLAATNLLLLRRSEFSLHLLLDEGINAAHEVPAVSIRR